MKILDAVTLLAMREHNPRHALRVLYRSAAVHDAVVHAGCLPQKLDAPYGFAIPEPDDPPMKRDYLCAICRKRVVVMLDAYKNSYVFLDPLP